MPNKILDWLAFERDRFVLWVPVGVGLGAGLYFILKAEPAVWVLLLALLPGALAFVPNAAIRAMGRIWLSVAVGFAVAWGQTHRIAAPVLPKELSIRQVSGLVREIEAGTEKSRVTLEEPVIDRLPKEQTPERIRITLKAKPELENGDRISLLAGLYPPPRPASPGSFDFQRHFFFERLGAVGYGVGDVTITQKTDHSRFRHQVNTIRQSITANLRDALPAPHGAIAAALITGDTRAIPEGVNETMRVAGLYHLLAVSGMNLAIVAGLLFFSIRLLLVLIPGLALHYPVKKWAAGIALIGSYGYLLIAGEPVSAERAFIMTALVLVAVLFDRMAFTLRSLAFAALAVILIEPQAVLAPGFQLSFAATIALVSIYEHGREPFSHWREDAGWFKRAVLYLAITGLTTLAAGLATAPYAIYHFNRFSNFSLLANLLVIPLVSFWIMPLLVVLVLLLPLGITWPFAWLISQGIALMLWLAGLVAALPHASITLPAPTGWGLASATLGGLWFFLWKSRIRYAGLFVVLLGLTTMAMNPPPDVYVNGNGTQVAVRDASGQLVLARGISRGLSGESWLERNGQTAFLKPGQGEYNGEISLRCDREGCAYRRYGHDVAILSERGALAEECGADAVIALFGVRRGPCRGVLVIDRIDLYRNGGYALWLGKRMRIESVAEEQGVRPWSPLP